MKNFHIFTKYTHYLSVIQNESLNNLFVESFQLMSSYAKNKQQMCWVTQHQCRSRQMWKIFTNSPSTLTFCLLQKNDFVLPEQSIHGKCFNSLGCPLMRRTNNRCVESLNISVEVAKCGKYSQIHPVHWLFVYYKKNLSSNNLFMVMFQLIWMSLMQDFESR